MSTFNGYNAMHYNPLYAYMELSGGNSILGARSMKYFLILFVTACGDKEPKE
ncbi:hypothetical protein [Salinicoccus sp. YB14-2]|uniref:hypothetical protein n=1 Tax=Salinicoccus sp. YB14-2 TaxID=1572701 RepID=UPI0012E18EC7|nr:hypothetical protein [Salinicoccus sp. YB14-2]